MSVYYFIFDVAYAFKKNSIAGMFSCKHNHINVTISIGYKLTLFNISDCNLFVLFYSLNLVCYSFIYEMLGGLFLCQTISLCVYCVY